MVQWMDVQTLIWLFPVLFIIHDFEEIILVEKWLTNNTSRVYKRLPTKLANRVVKQFSMSTAQFAVAVFVIFLFVSSSTLMASQYVMHGPLSSIYFFIIVSLTFFLHAFTHIAQAFFLRSITPGAVTSLIVIIPYSLVLYHSLLENEIITWKMIFICMPFGLLLIPVALLAHWVGKMVI